MRIQIGAVILVLCILCGAANASEESQEKKRTTSETAKLTKNLSLHCNVNSEEGYYQAVATLEKKHAGVQVETTLKKFLENPDKYLTLLTKKYLFRTEHSAHWFDKFAEAAEYAKKSDWKSCELAATKGLNEKADEPVLIFLRAVAHKKLNKNTESLSDLSYLCSVKANRNIDQDWNKHYEPEEREFFDFLLI